MLHRFQAVLRRIFTTPYRPNPAVDTFRARAQTQSSTEVEVTVAVLDAPEADHYFGTPLARRGIQPVHLRVTNRSRTPLRLQLLTIDPNYYTPLEAAAANHFSIAKRLTAFGLVAWVLLPFVILLIPFKLLTAFWANGRMDDFFSSQAFHLRPIQPGSVAEGFVFTSLDIGTKVVHICLLPTGDLVDMTTVEASPHPNVEQRVQQPVEFTFSMTVPGLSVDYLQRDFATLEPAGSTVECDLPTLVGHLDKMPPATSNGKGSRSGDPVNLVVIAEFVTVIGAFAARWDESETITLATCWKTVRAFLLGSQYRYSPVSPLYLFSRSQDVALQRTRHSINERLHLRLWLTPLTYHAKPVWVGQVSRDIGVRWTSKAWNLTTHRIDPDVDEARDYVIQDLLQAERVEAAGYVDGVGPCDRAAPRHNLTGDFYFTDGKRAVVELSAVRTKPSFMKWG